MWMVIPGRPEPYSGDLEYRLKVIEIAKAMFKSRLADPVAVDIRIYLDPASQRGDLDNYVKAILDSLNGVAWEDDSQVVQLAAKIEFGKSPRGVPRECVEVSVRALPDSGSIWVRGRRSLRSVRNWRAFAALARAGHLNPAGAGAGLVRKEKVAFSTAAGCQQTPLWDELIIQAAAQVSTNLAWALCRARNLGCLLVPKWPGTQFGCRIVPPQGESPEAAIRRRCYFSIRRRSLLPFAGQLNRLLENLQVW